MFCLCCFNPWDAIYTNDTALDRVGFSSGSLSPLVMKMTKKETHQKTGRAMVMPMSIRVEGIPKTKDVATHARVTLMRTPKEK